ncbi:MAG: hypothetical protein Kow00123_25550 [Anaerolineales bacterium]
MYNLSCDEVIRQDAIESARGLGRAARAVVLAVLVVALAALGWRAYAQTAVPVALWVDGQPRFVTTHAATVGALLEQQGLRLSPADAVWPAPETPLTPEMTVTVERARTVTIRADGQTLTIQTRAVTPSQILAGAGIHVGEADVVLADGQPVAPSATNPSPNPRAASSRGAWQDIGRRDALTLEVRRAVPLTVSDGGVAARFLTTAATVGEALAACGVNLLDGDSAFPDADAPVVPGMTVSIRRATPVEIEVDSRLVSARVQGATVADALAEAGIVLVGLDYTDPPADTPLQSGMRIQVIRLRQAFTIEQEPIAYSVVWQPDPSLEIDQRRLIRPGEEGLRKRRIRTVIRDGAEVQRDVMDEWVAMEPKDQVFAYGTKIVIRELETPYGTIQYWRKLRVLATSYTAATSGKTRDHPEYGITRVGWRARKGIIAVDPTVVNLKTKMYVPGYGIGDVGDTGGAIKGLRIDLCYDEDNLVLWKKWVDVYLLAPPPPPDQIRYVLPDWPVESR